MKRKCFLRGAIGWPVAARDAKFDLKFAIQRGDPQCQIEVEAA